MVFTITGISTVSLFYIDSMAMSNPQLDDESLAQRTKEGNRKAFQQFYKHQINPLYKMKKAVSMNLEHVLPGSFENAVTLKNYQYITE